MKHTIQRILLSASIITSLVMLVFSTVAWASSGMTTVSVEVWDSLTLDTVDVKAWPEKRVTIPGGNLDTKLRLQIKDTTSTTLELEDTFTSTGTGTYAGVDVSSLSPGYYDLFIKGESHLADKMDDYYLTPLVTELDFTESETIYMRAGDINGTNFGDGVVNAIDLSILIENLDGFALRSDLNRDNIVNALDLSALIVNLDDVDEL